MEEKKPQHVSILSVIMVRLRFVMLFVVVGFLVARWDWINAHVEKWIGHEKSDGGVVGEFEYFCPMHPSVVRNEMGNCPICGMGLSKRKRGEPEKLDPGVLSRKQYPPFRIRQAGVATVEAKFRSLVREIRAVGFIEYDERRVARLSARIAGRADELSVNYVGAEVKEGDPVYKLYSPDLNSAQKEYVLAIRTRDELKAQTGASAIALEQAGRLVDSARERLSLWGITKDQIEELGKTQNVQTHLIIYSPISGIVAEKRINAGQYVMEGDAPFTIVDDSVVWMQAEVFERDMSAIAVGQEVAVTTEAWPGEVFVGTVAFLYPTLSPETRTVKVRVEIPNRERRLRPGMYATATLRLPAGKYGEVFYTCCEGCGTKSEEEGGCPKCQRAMVKRGGVEDDGGGTEGTSKERKIYVCHGHPDWVSDAPVPCPKCSGMIMEEEIVPAGHKVVYRCEEHPVHQSDKPGKCPECGKDYAYAIVKAGGGKLVEAYVCPLDPIRTAEGKLKCPDCGCEMKRLQYEEVLAVPLEAVIDTGERHVVYVDRGEGTFEGVEVMIGPRAGDYYPVLSGLKEGDKVVTAGAFLLDSETRLNPAASAAYFGASGQETEKEKK